MIMEMVCLFMSSMKHANMARPHHPETEAGRRESSASAERKEESPILLIPCQRGKLHNGLFVI